MSDSLQPHRRQPTRLPSPWDSPGKNTGVGCHALVKGTPYRGRLWTLASAQLTIVEGGSGIPILSPSSSCGYKPGKTPWKQGPVFLPGESQGQGSLVSCCLWGRTESGATEATWHETTLMAESEEELKSLMMKVKGESQKAGLKLNIQKTKIIACSIISDSANLWTIGCQAPLSMGFSRQTSTGVSCHFLLQGIFLTQGALPCHS